MRGHRWLGVVLGAGLLVCVRARAGEEEKVVPKAEPVSEAEKAKLLAAETPKQRALRAELARLKTKILFNANPEGNNDIFIANADGSDVKQLTSGPADDTYPHLSPDGKRVVFQRDEVLGKEAVAGMPFDERFPLNWKRKIRNDKKAPAIWTMNVDGSDAKRVAVGASLPHWSPNGKVICYTIYQGRGHLPGLLDLGAKTERALKVTGLRNGGHPCFSPDGKWLFVSNGAGVMLPMNEAQNGLAEGGAPLTVIRGHPCNGEISPDGKWVMTVADTHKCLGSWLVYAPFDGKTGKVGRGKHFDLGWEKKTVNYFPDFSPCGKYFTYVHAESEDGVKSWLVTKNQEIYIARFPADGTAVRVTWTNAASQHPHWTREPVGPEKPKGDPAKRN